MPAARRPSGSGLPSCGSGHRPAAVARAGRGGGTTLPGRVLLALAPRARRAARRGAAARQRRRLGDQRQDDDLRDGRGDPRPELPLCRNAAGANLLSGVARGALEAPTARLPARPVRVRRGRAARGRPPRRGRTRWRSGTSSATSSTATASSSWWPSAGASWSPGCRVDDARGRLRRRPAHRRPRDGHARRRVRYGIDDPALALATLRARLRLALLRALRARLRLRDRLLRPPRRLPLPALRPRPSAARRRRPQIEQRGLEPTAFDLRTPLGTRPRRARPARPVQRLERARGGGAVALVARRVARGHRGRAGALPLGVRALPADRARRSLGGHAADQEPRRGQRGAARRSRAARATLHTLVALNDRIADGTRRLVDLGRRLGADRARTRPRRRRGLERGGHRPATQVRGRRRLPDHDRARPRARPRRDAARRRRRRQRLPPADLHRDARAAGDHRRTAVSSDPTGSARA